MATYSQIRNGARGDEVKELQKLLNQNGYSLVEDGIFGSKTQTAVEDYQRKNNLSVDGIVGNNTWGALLGTGTSSNNAALNIPTTTPNGTTNASPSSSSTSSSKSTADYLADYEHNMPQYAPSQALIDAEKILAEFENKKPGEYVPTVQKPGEYTPSQEVIDAERILAEHLGTKPGAYQGTYSEQIDSMLEDIMDRQKFSYDFATDPTYQQYADKYQQQGKLAMMDTMGQAAALTGGNASSYAQSVGQQAYQGYLQNLNDIIPELRDAAYQRYVDEGEQMLTRLSILQGLEDQEYGRHRDDVSDYMTELARLTEEQRYLSEQDYGRHIDALNEYWNEEKYNYGMHRDEVGDYMTELARLTENQRYLSEQEYNRFLNELAAREAERNYYYGKQQDEQAQENWKKEFDLAKGSSSSSSSSGSGSRSSSSSSGSRSESSYGDVGDNAQDGGITYSDLFTLFEAGELKREHIKAAEDNKYITKEEADKLRGYLAAKESSIPLSERNP